MSDKPDYYKDNFNTDIFISKGLNVGDNNDDNNTNQDDTNIPSSDDLIRDNKFLSNGIISPKINYLESAEYACRCTKENINQYCNKDHSHLINKDSKIDWSVYYNNSYYHINHPSPNFFHQCKDHSKIVEEAIIIKKMLEKRKLHKKKYKLRGI